MEYLKVYIYIYKSSSCPHTISALMAKVLRTRLTAPIKFDLAGLTTIFFLILDWCLPVPKVLDDPDEIAYDFTKNP